MAKHSREICGIEIGKDILVIIQYSPETNSISSIAIKPIEETGEGWWKCISREFNVLADTMKLNGQDTICSLPSEHAVIQKFLLEKSEDNLEDVIQWELSQNIIGSMDDYVFDFETVASDTDRQVSLYLVAAYRSSYLANIKTLLKARRLNPYIVDLDIFALVNVYEYNYPEEISAPALLVLGTETCTKAVLTHNGRLLDYEFFNHPSDSFEPADYAAKINANIDKLVSINSSIIGKQTLPVYVTGTMFSNEEFSNDSLSSIENSTVLYPFKNVSCRALSEGDLLKYSTQMAIGTGLALRATPELKK